MREIKFRAWIQNKMHRVYVIDWNDKQIISISTAHGKYYPDDEYGDIVKLMQYTGLKDSTGKEIYEGDIVILCSQSENIGVVEYFAGSFVVGGEDMFIDPGSYKIIGNRHENPELLEV